MDLNSRLGIIGAGRLGEALAKMWLLRTGEAPLIWSRGGPCANGSAETRVASARWVTNWTSTLEAQSLVIAIPGRPLLDLVSRSGPASKFEGNVFSAAASLSRASLQRAFPRATIICFSPFLIDGVNSTPMLVLRPPDLSLSQWLKAKAELEGLGAFDVVEDEQVFSHVALLGASWPVVVLSAVQKAANAGVAKLEDENAKLIGKRIFSRGVQSLLQQGTAHEVATPGGITERGLKSLAGVNGLFESVFEQMQARAAELRE